LAGFRRHRQRDQKDQVIISSSRIQRERLSIFPQSAIRNPQLGE
jgi:hypothetical protein